MAQLSEDILTKLKKIKKDLEQCNEERSKFPSLLSKVKIDAQDAIEGMRSNLVVQTRQNEQFRRELKELKDDAKEYKQCEQKNDEYKDEIKKLKQQQKEHYERTNIIQEELKNKNKTEMKKFIDFLNNYNNQITDIVKNYEKTGMVQLKESKPIKSVQQESIMIDSKDLVMPDIPKKEPKSDFMKDLKQDTFKGLWDLDIQYSDKLKNLGSVDISKYGELSFNFKKDSSKDESDPDQPENIFQSIIDIDMSDEKNPPIIRYSNSEKKFIFDCMTGGFDRNGDFVFKPTIFNIKYYIHKNYEYINIIDTKDNSIFMLSRKRKIQNIKKEGNKLIYTDGQIKQIFNIKKIDSDGNCFYKALADQISILNLFEDPLTHQSLRKKAIRDIGKSIHKNYLSKDILRELEKEHTEGGEKVRFDNVNDYTDYHEQDGKWVDNGIILILAKNLDLTINIYNVSQNSKIVINENKDNDKVYLEYTGNHYNSLELIKEEKIEESQLIPDEYIKKWKVNHHYSTLMSTKITQTTYTFEIKENQSVITDMKLPYKNAMVYKDKIVIFNPLNKDKEQIELPITYSKKNSLEMIYVYEKSKQTIIGKILPKKLLFVLTFDPSEKDLVIDNKYIKTWNLFNEQQKPSTFTGITFKISNKGLIDISGNIILKEQSYTIPTTILEELGLENPRFNGTSLITQDLKDPLIIKILPTSYVISEKDKIQYIYINSDVTPSKVLFSLQYDYESDIFDPFFYKEKFWEIYIPSKSSSSDQFFRKVGDMIINQDGSFNIYSDRFSIKADRGEFKNNSLILYVSNNMIELPLKREEDRNNDTIDIYNKNQLYIRLISIKANALKYKDTIQQLIQIIDQEIKEESSIASSLYFYQQLKRRELWTKIDSLKDDLVFLNKIKDYSNRPDTPLKIKKLKQIVNDEIDKLKVANKDQYKINIIKNEFLKSYEYWSIEDQTKIFEKISKDNFALQQTAKELENRLKTLVLINKKLEVLL